MSNVPKSKRVETDFTAQTHFKSLRKSITALLLNDFGYRPDKMEDKIKSYYEAHKDNPNIDAICERLEKKNTSFVEWFIDEEAKTILDIMREIEREFTLGNSIYPSETPAKIVEFLIRRWHMDKAIGLCYTLKNEVNYVISTLMTDKNKSEMFDKDIDLQIKLYRGIRRSDNKLIKSRQKKTEITIESEITKMFNSIANIIRKIGKIEEDAQNNVDEPDKSQDLLG